VVVVTQAAWYFCGGVVVLIGLLSLGSALTSRGYRFASGRISGVVGKMGSGKSLFVVTKVILPAARTMQKKHGLVCGHTGRRVRRLITNFSIELPYDVEVIHLDGSRIWDHLVELAHELGGDSLRLDALVIIDEAHLFMPSDKMKMATKARWITSMARKMNAEIWWITQNEMKIHKRLRDDTQLIWRVGRSASLWTIIAGPSKWFTARAYEPERLNRLNAQPEDQRRYRLSKTAIKAYDSFELIVPDAEADVSLDSLAKRRAARLAPLGLVPTEAEKGTTDTATSFPYSAVPVVDADERTG
jgi:hypothetical protein